MKQSANKTFQCQAFVNLVHDTPGITPQEEMEIINCFKPLSLRNKEFFLKEGEICKRIAYVCRGCLCYFRLFENGKKSVIQFAFEDWWVGDLESFLNNKPSANFWQSLENSELIYISSNDFEKLMNTSRAFQSVFITKTRTAYIKSLERSAKDKSQSGKERYLRMINDHPQIINRVPHYDVAAYLGITPESLSRIRHKLATRQR